MQRNIRRRATQPGWRAHLLECGVFVIFLEQRQPAEATIEDATGLPAPVDALSSGYEPNRLIRKLQCEK